MKIKIKLSTGKKITLTRAELKELLDFKGNQFFCVVFHYWFQDSKYFQTYYIKADNIREARKEALLIKEETEDTWNKCAFEIIEIFKKS